MANPDLMNEAIRKKIIDEIKGEENKRRKAESLKRFEVYRERQDRYIMEKLRSEFSERTVNEMRKITSVSLATRVINNEASIYNSKPERFYGDASDAEKEQLDNLYKYAKADTKMMLANRYYKLNDQCFIQVVPRNGKVDMRVLLPHHIDCVPDEMDPERPYCYIISVMDKFEYLGSEGTSDTSNPSRNPLRSSEYIDNRNQMIADADDYKASMERYEVWSDEFNFIMDGHGRILTEEVINPIGMIPIVDVSSEKDFEFFVRRGSSVVDFSIQFGAQLSDLATIVKNQCYAQAIIYAERQPENMTIGPNYVLFMQLDANRPELRPSFEFANPGSDIDGAIKSLEMTLRLFLTAKGVDPKTVTGDVNGQSFTSGIERLLSEISRFEASKMDMELFRWTEVQIFKLMRAWSNFYQGDSAILMDELQNGQISEDVTFMVKFSEPQAMQTKTDKEDSVIKLLDKGLMTKLDAIKEIHGVDDIKAQEMLDQIVQEKTVMVPTVEVMQ